MRVRLEDDFGSFEIALKSLEWPAGYIGWISNYGRCRGRKVRSSSEWSCFQALCMKRAAWHLETWSFGPFLCPGHSVYNQ